MVDMNKPTNDPTIDAGFETLAQIYRRTDARLAEQLVDFERKIRMAERAAVLAYLCSHEDMPARELRDAIAAGAHLRELVPVTGPDPRD
jgi:hypothetical protein